VPSSAVNDGAWKTCACCGMGMESSWCANDQRQALFPPPVLRGRVREGVRASGASLHNPPALPRNTGEGERTASGHPCQRQSCLLSFTTMPDKPNVFGHSFEDDEHESAPGAQAPAKVDFPRIERAVREILLAIGEDPDREGLKK